MTYHMKDITVRATLLTPNGIRQTKDCLINGAELCVDIWELTRQALRKQHDIEFCKIIAATVLEDNQSSHPVVIRPTDTTSLPQPHAS